MHYARSVKCNLFDAVSGLNLHPVAMALTPFKIAEGFPRPAQGGAAGRWPFDNEILLRRSWLLNMNAIVLGKMDAPNRPLCSSFPITVAGHVSADFLLLGKRVEGALPQRVERLEVAEQSVAEAENRWSWKTDDQECVTHPCTGMTSEFLSIPSLIGVCRLDFPGFEADFKALLKYTRAITTPPALRRFYLQARRQ